jgi:hypothetical protein
MASSRPSNLRSATTILEVLRVQQFDLLRIESLAQQAESIARSQTNRAMAVAEMRLLFRQVVALIEFDRDRCKDVLAQV